MFTLCRPSNVLLNEYSNLKLCDFGLAKKIVDLLQTDSESNKVKLTLCLITS